MHFDWLTLILGVALIGLGVFYYRRAEVSAEQAAQRNWKIGVGGYRVMALLMIISGAVDLAALVLAPLFHGTSA